MINIPASVVRTDLDPLIVTSPTARSGTTLVQRLLCSSRRAVIYGELCAQDLEFFLNLYSIKTQEYNYNRAILERGLHQVLAGDVDDWIPDLMPDVDGYLRAMGHSAFAGIEYCRDYAHRSARPVWGLKHPGWKPAFIQLLRAFMPHARFIAILRDLEPTVRSAKAKSMLNSITDTQQFCRTWAEGMEYWCGLRDDSKALVLSYEELITAPEVELGRLAEFSGLNDIRSEVLQHKINAWTGKLGPYGSVDGYLAPAELTGAEHRVIDQVAEGFREKAQP
jgi:hypothetical protein